MAHKQFMHYTLATRKPFNVGMCGVLYGESLKRGSTCN
uniref:Uncharacterized protein n=1 Tax=Anguilla anguilla TaxID=7936 RepID=A0A0E9WTC1_ANGAN